MFDHVTLKVRDYHLAEAFYDQALKPLGLRRLAGDGERFAGYGDGRPFFWIGQGDVPSCAHVAFEAVDRATVAGFHAAALAAGGRDNGAPGLRPEYDATYYGGFVLDLDGNNIEAVCRARA